MHLMPTTNNVVALMSVAHMPREMSQENTFEDPTLRKWHPAPQPDKERNKGKQQTCRDRIMSQSRSHTSSAESDPARGDTGTTQWQEEANAQTGS
jgi:hypothetical protein